MGGNKGAKTALQMRGGKTAQGVPFGREARSQVVLSAILLAPPAGFPAAGCRCDHSREAGING